MDFRVLAIEDFDDLDFVFSWCGLIICGGKHTK